MASNPRHERRHVHYHGRVQGVGFRYTTRSIAGRYKVRGYVRNLPDGRVELVVEGDRNELAAFLDEVRERLGHHIRDEMVDTQSPSGEFAIFEIRH